MTDVTSFCALQLKTKVQGWIAAVEFPPLWLRSWIKATGLLCHQKLHSSNPVDYTADYSTVHSLEHLSSLKILHWCIRWSKYFFFFFINHFNPPSLIWSGPGRLNKNYFKGLFLHDLRTWVLNYDVMIQTVCKFQLHVCQYTPLIYDGIFLLLE